MNCYTNYSVRLNISFEEYGRPQHTHNGKLRQCKALYVACSVWLGSLHPGLSLPQQDFL